MKSTQQLYIKPKIHTDTMNENMPCKLHLPFYHQTTPFSDEAHKV